MESNIKAKSKAVNRFNYVCVDRTGLQKPIAVRANTEAIRFHDFCVSAGVIFPTCK